MSLSISEAFTYAGTNAVHVAVTIDGQCWIHRTPFPEMRNPSHQNPGLIRLLEAVRAAGAINPARWERLGASSRRP